jgi:hypothetical protein
MKPSQTDKKIKALALSAKDGKNERSIRENAQLIFLLIQSDFSLTRNEKEALLNSLRVAVRPLLKSDYRDEKGCCELNSLLREMCLAASFYLLEKEKRIRLYEADGDCFVKINKRLFENCFYFITSRLLMTDDEINIEIRPLRCWCSVVITAKRTNDSFILTPPENVFSVFSDGESGLAMNMRKSENLYNKKDGEDFSLLLSDSLSPLQIWMCDV